MKIKILIKEKLDKIYNILPLIQNNEFLKDNAKNIEYYNENNWEHFFNNIVEEMNLKKIERVCIFDDDGILPFIFFSKQKSFVVSCPNSAKGANLSRAHNNANCIVMSCKNVDLSNMDEILNIFFTTEHLGGRHALRVKLMKEPFSETKGMYSFNKNIKDTVVICSDHAGYIFKENIKEYLINQKHLKVIDVGCSSTNSCHYPLFAIAMILNENKAFTGIAICSTGVGISNTLNNFKGINSFMCLSSDQAKLARSKYNLNVLALGANIISLDEAKKAVDQYLDTPQGSSLFMKAMDKYGYGFNKDLLKAIKIDGNTEIPKELEQLFKI